MSLFDSASLCITPNGYKEDKLYAIKPDDGSGDLVVTRATTATRVNGDGLIEVTPYNLLQRSQEFDNAVWAISGTITKTANSVNSPNGTLTADTILGANASSYISQSYTGTNGVVYTNSFFIKNNNSTQSLLLIRNTVSTISANINWSGSVLTSITNGLGVTTFEDYGNGWYRIISTYTALEDAQRARIYPTTSTDQSVYLWGAQLVTGSVAKDYFPTTDRLNIPRLDYTNGSCPSILVEPQRTNLILQSQTFDNASWTKVNLAISANTIISPDGTTTADTITDDSTNGLHVVVQYSTWQAITQTASVYAKAGTASKIFIGNLSQGRGSYFDLSTQTVVDSSLFSGTITSVGNGWFRLTATHTAGTNNQTFGIGLFTGTSTTSYAGSGQTAYLWGAQLEAGSYHTSYIPTVASTITRNADVISKTGISSLIGQTEGTMFVDVNFKADSVFKNLFNLGTSTSSYIAIVVRSNNKIGAEVLNSGVQVNNDGSTIYTSQRLKIAFAYKANDFAMYVNGVLAFSQNTGSVPAKAEVYLGSYGNGTQQPKDGINASALWKTRLDNETLAQLTTI